MGHKDPLTAQGMKKQLLYCLPIFLLVSAMLFIYLSGIYHDLSFNAIRLKHAEWKHYIQAHPYQSALYFIGIYTTSVCLIIPDSTFLSVVAGLLFPLPLAIFYIVVSETLGATVFLWAVETAFQSSFYRKKGIVFQQLQQKLQHNQVYYLLFFRFSHLIPFWLINVVSALLNIPKWTFLWTTCIGILPLSVILAQAGAGLSHYLEHHTHFSIDNIFTLQIKITLVCLGILALLPLFFQSLNKKR